MSLNLLQSALELENRELQQKLAQKDQFLTRQQNMISKLRTELTAAEKSVPEGFMNSFREMEEDLEETENELSICKKNNAKLTEDIQQLRIEKSEVYDELADSKKVVSALIDRDHAISTNLVLLSKAVMNAVTEIVPSFMMKSMSAGKIGENDIPPLAQTLLNVPAIPYELRTTMTKLDIDMDVLDAEEGFGDLNIAINSLKLSAHARIETNKVLRSQMNSEVQKMRFEMAELRNENETLKKTVEEQNTRAAENDETVRRKLEHVMSLQKMQLDIERKKLADTELRLGQTIELLNEEKAKTQQLEAALDTLERESCEKDMVQSNMIVSKAYRESVAQDAMKMKSEIDRTMMESEMWSKAFNNNPMNSYTGLTASQRTNRNIANNNNVNRNNIDEQLEASRTNFVSNYANTSISPNSYVEINNDDIENISLINENIDPTLSCVITETPGKISEEALAARLFDQKVRQSCIGRSNAKGALTPNNGNSTNTGNINSTGSINNNITTINGDLLHSFNNTKDSVNQSIIDLDSDNKTKITNEILKRISMGTARQLNGVETHESMKPDIELNNN